MLLFAIVLIIIIIIIIIFVHLQPTVQRVLCEQLKSPNSIN
jgi:ABC-type bacteriocin/lantibiotic exporter with double-glycine peptidase domain